jgi:hypothetical protein
VGKAWQLGCAILLAFVIVMTVVAVAAMLLAHVALAA